MANYDILVGIPTLNEADSVGFVLDQIDAGLSEYFSDYKCLICNVDSGSQDGTREVFSAISSNNEKLTVNAKLQGGKGENIFKLLDLAHDLQAKYIATIDGDIKSVTKDWVRNLLKPIIDERFDYVSALYTRNRYEGSTTNHLCVPTLRTVYDANIRQPIGGDFAFNSKFSDIVRNSEKPQPAYAYGIDIFLTTTAVVNNLSVKESYLGQKFHKPSFGKMVPMFMQVCETLLYLVQKFGQVKFDSDKLVVGENRGAIDSKSIKPSQEDITKRRNFAIETLNSTHSQQNTFPIEHDLVQRISQNDYLVPKSVWEQALGYVLKSCLDKYSLEENKIARLTKFITPIFLLRVLTFYGEIDGLDENEIESLIVYNIAL